LLHVIGKNAFEFFGVFKKWEEGGLINIFAVGDVDWGEVFAGFTQFNDDCIIDGDWGKY
jgi:hypothetical protein